MITQVDTIATHQFGATRMREIKISCVRDMMQYCGDELRSLRVLSREQLTLFDKTEAAAIKFTQLLEHCWKVHDFSALSH